MRWLVTGGCGFVGLNLVRLLLKEERDTQIRLFDDLSVGTRHDLEGALADCQAERGRVELIEGDIRDIRAISAAARGADVMVHLAARTGVVPSISDPRADFDTNALGTLNCLEAARHARMDRFVFISSGAPAGEKEGPLRETDAPSPASPYGASKLAGEGYASAYQRSFGLGTVTLRFSNLYGPLAAHKQSAVAQFIRNALAGEDLVIYGDGSQSRDFLFVRDAVAAIRAAARSNVAGELFQIATGVETPIARLVSVLREALEPRVGEIRVVQRPARAGEVFRSCADPSKAKALLGWVAEWSLEAGIRETIRSLALDR
jgi:UDP-glucose 4-epimerase